MRIQSAAFNTVAFSHTRRVGAATAGVPQLEEEQAKRKETRLEKLIGDVYLICPMTGEDFKHVMYSLTPQQAECSQTINEKASHFFSKHGIELPAYLK